MAYAKAKNKPVVLEFTGYACVNSRKMENNVWLNESVYKVLKSEVVLISLHVDDRTKLPSEEVYTSQITGKIIDSYGEKWTDYQMENFDMNSQPHYVFMDAKGNQLISEEATYNTHNNPDDFARWLQKGLRKFKLKYISM